MTPDLFDADLLAIGEPTHGEHAFPQIRNHLFAELVERGFRSIALETDRVAALTANAFVHGADVRWAEGFTHSFGTEPANRDLLFWMRDHNAGRPDDDQLNFYGFDGPTEPFYAPEADAYLRVAFDFLGHETDPADLLDELLAAAPGSDPAAWRRAEANAAAGLMLLRYHARPDHQIGLRDAFMARSLLTIRAAEAHRGRTLVFAHNRHLQRHRARMRWLGEDVAWTGAGAIVSALLGERYRMIAGSLGASPALGLGTPEGASFEGRLRSLSPYAFVKPAEIPPADPRSAPDWYFPLDAETIAQADAVLHVPTGVAPAMLTERILALPGVEHQEAAGDLFFFVGAERMRPFATIVHNDVPDFDELSELHRPGVFRLNVDLGKHEFERRFGFPPKALPDHLSEYDFARTDEVVPHPAYGTAAWASIVMPSPWRLTEVDELIAHAHRRHVRP